MLFSKGKRKSRIKVPKNSNDSAPRYFLTRWQTLVLLTLPRVYRFKNLSVKSSVAMTIFPASTTHRKEESSLRKKAKNFSSSAKWMILTSVSLHVRIFCSKADYSRKLKNERRFSQSKTHLFPTKFYSVDFLFGLAVSV